MLSTLPIDKKLKARKHSPAFSKGKHSFGKEGQLENHIGIVQIQATKSDDPNKYKSFIPTDMHIAGEDNCVNDTDIPERMQIIQDIVGSAIVRMSIEEESSWILCQLASNINPLFNEAKSCRLVDTAKREDIISFLELRHTMKYDIPFIAMYRKEQCLSLLEDLKLEESENIFNDIERNHMLKWHQAAVMLSSEIPFRKYVSTIFMDKALVSTSPTIKGNTTVDSFHEFAGVKWLWDKPLSKFLDSQAIHSEG